VVDTEGKVGKMILIWTKRRETHSDIASFSRCESSVPLG